MALGEEKDIFIFIFLLSVILLVAEDLGAANIIVFVWSQWVAATLGWGGRFRYFGGLRLKVDVADVGLLD